MSWDGRVDVTGGRVWWRPDGETPGYAIEGLVDCEERLRERLSGVPEALDLRVEHKAWFRTVEDRGEPLRPKNPTQFVVLGGVLELKPRKPQLMGWRWQPSSFIDLCQGLLVLPSIPHRDQWGYVFTASLQVEGWKLPLLQIDDTSHSERSFVQLALLESHLRFAAHNEAWDFVPDPEQHPLKHFTARQLFELALVVRYGWPLNLDWLQ
jgi:hypothetical protein